jgi:hypothetical protein
MYIKSCFCLIILYFILLQKLNMMHICDISFAVCGFFVGPQIFFGQIVPWNFSHLMFTQNKKYFFNNIIPFSSLSDIQVI